MEDCWSVHVERLGRQTNSQVDIVVAVNLYLTMTDLPRVDKTRRPHPRITTKIKHINPDKSERAETTY